jgi:hypothetical protein
MGWLLKLPCEVTVRCAGEGPDGSVLDEFKRDRKKVDSVDELKEFVNTWIAIWDETNSKDRVSADEVGSNTLKHFKRLQHYNAKFNPEDADQQLAMRILMPGRVLEAGLIAQKFKAPFNVALIQRFADDEDRKVVF